MKTQPQNADYKGNLQIHNNNNTYTTIAHIHLWKQNPTNPKEPTLKGQLHFHNELGYITQTQNISLWEVRKTVRADQEVNSTETGDMTNESKTLPNNKMKT